MHVLTGTHQRQHINLYVPQHPYKHKHTDKSRNKQTLNIIMKAETSHIINLFSKGTGMELTVPQAEFYITPYFGNLILALEGRHSH